MTLDLFGPSTGENSKLFAKLAPDRPEHHLTDDRPLGMFQLAEYLARYPWNPSITRAFNPHWYIMDHHWKAAGGTQADFNRATGLIYKFGFDSKWRGWTYRAININGGHFWNLQAPGHEDYDDIINGKFTFYNTYWNFIASRYHELSNKVSAIIGERMAQLEIIGDLKDKTVLEIGCGPGWLIEYTKGGIGRYTGIDYSQRMLTEFAARHPSWYKRTRVCSMKDYYSPGEKYDVILALSGMGSTMRWSDVEKCLLMLEPGGKLISVCYRAVERTPDNIYNQLTLKRYGITDSFVKGDRPFRERYPSHEIGSIYEVYEMTPDETFFENRSI